MKNSISIVLADSDEKYIQRLSTGIQRKWRGGIRSIKSFTDEKQMMEYARRARNSHIWLLSPQYAQAIKEYEVENCVCVLTEHRQEPGQSMSHDMNTIYKYEQVNRLLTLIQERWGSVYGGSAAAISGAGLRKVTSLAIVSPGGGCGKTTIALNLCHQLALRGHKTFYLNLEQYPSVHFAPTSKYDLSRALYLLAENRARLLEQFDLYVRECPIGKFYYFNPPCHLHDIEEFAHGTVNELIEVIGHKDYDFIVTDMNIRLFGAAVQRKLNFSQVWWLVSNDFFGRNLLQAMEFELKKNNCIKVIVNKCRSSETTFKNSFISAMLPYCPAFHEMTKLEHMYFNDHFNDALYQTYLSLLS